MKTIPDFLLLSVFRSFSRPASAGISEVAVMVWLVIFCLLIPALVITGLLALRYRRLMEKARTELSNANEATSQFLNSFSSLVYIKDEKMQYVMVNKAFAEYEGIPPEAFYGKTDFEITDHKVAEVRQKTDLDALAAGKPLTTLIVRDGRIFRSTKFPVRLANGKFGVGAMWTKSPRNGKTRSGYCRPLTGRGL